VNLTPLNPVLTLSIQLLLHRQLLLLLRSSLAS
jgi:hypothetical protein